MRIETIRANENHIVQSNTSGIANEYSKNVLRVKLNSVKDKFRNIDDEKKLYKICSLANDNRLKNNPNFVEIHKKYA